MKQAGNLAAREKLDRDRVLKLVRDKIQQINWDSAKDDMRVFISDTDRLKIWSPQFFSEFLDHLLVEEKK